MGTSASGINIGDAVLSVLIDLTQLNQGLAQLNTDVPAKLKSSGDAAASLGKSFTDAGTAASAAGTQIAAGVQAPTAKIQTLQAEVTKLKAQLQDTGKSSPGFEALQAKIVELQAQIAVLNQKFKEVGPAVGESVRKGAAEIGLLGEATGVVLPRHVRSFLAELPGVGVALEAAFSATAVLFLIEALIKGGEKIEEFAEKPEKINEAWRDVGDESAKATQGLTKGLDDAQAKIIGLTQGPLSEMDYKIQHIGTDAQTAAKLVGDMGVVLLKALDQQAISQYNPLAWWNDTARDDAKEAEKFFGQLQSDVSRFGSEAGIVSINAKLGTLKTTLQTVNDQLSKESTTAGKDVFQNRIDGLTKYKAVLEDLNTQLKASQKIQDDEKTADILEKRREQGQALAEEAQRDLATDLANIKLREATEHQAFVDGDIDAASWAVAQKNAVDATQVAHERLAARLQDINQQFGLASNAQAVAQKLATDQTLNEASARETLAQSTEKYRESTQKILKDWQELQVSSVAKTFEEAQQAAQRLTLEEIKLAEAQENLTKAKAGVDFTAQEKGITDLANFGIISEQQKAERLRVLYQQEENDALRSLQNLLAKEKADVESAQTKLDAGKNNPFLSDAQVEDLQINLDRLKVIYDKTQQEIITTTASYEAKRIAVQRTAVGQAIALAQSEGRQKLAADLLFKQAQLDEINNEIRLARAHDQNTAALQRERKAIQDQIKELTQEAHSVGDTSKALVLMQTLGTEAVEGLGQAIESSFAAAISGQESFGAAMEAGTLRMISSMAQKWAMYFLGKAIPDLFTDPPLGEAELAGGIALEALAGATSGLASSIDSKAQKSASAGSSSSSSAGGGQVSPTQGAAIPVQTLNVQHLAGGGLFSKRTLAVIGDAVGGGDQREAVIPLGNDSRALDEIAGRIAERIGAGGPVYHQTFQFDGVISADNLNKVVKKISRTVTKGGARLNSSNTVRITKRS